MMYGELPARAYELQTALNKAYEQVLDSDLSWGDQRALEKSITAMECELESILQNQGQAVTPGGYLTDTGVQPASSTVVADSTLVLGSQTVEEKKKPLPWILIGLAAAGAAYVTVKG